MFQKIKFKLRKLIFILFYKPRVISSGNDILLMKPLHFAAKYVSLGDNIIIWTGARIESVYYNGTWGLLDIGSKVTIQQNSHITFSGKLTIGSNTTILSNVIITNIDHDHSDKNYNAHDSKPLYKETIIGKNCFIGANSVILPGTILGDNSVVGANSVLRGLYEANSIIAGNPAKLLRLKH